MTDDVQNVALDEVQAGLLARNIRILGRHVREMRPHAYLNDRLTCKSRRVVKYVREFRIAYN